ncbi:flagella synthesis protein FlgN [Endozoicomonas lisbonensis]|uniref:Flagella synthesis protein FlgN n=1 Tax=Endozoicomonas lisbonensis TaxID=3120522 RepID=A0ABV2SDF5_9GAMM
MQFPQQAPQLSCQREQTVIATIQQDLDLYSELHELLEQQQTFILNRDHQGLAESAQNITSLMLKARENRTRRSNAMKETGLNNTRIGMEAFLDRLTTAHREEIREDWQELVELVEDCQIINKVNSQALTLQNKMAEKILSQLPVQGGNNKTYSSSGQEQTSSRSILNKQA